MESDADAQNSIVWMLAVETESTSMVSTPVLASRMKKELPPESVKWYVMGALQSGDCTTVSKVSVVVVSEPM